MSSRLETYKTPLLILLVVVCVLTMIYCVRQCLVVSERCSQLEQVLRQHDGVLAQLIQPQPQRQTVVRRQPPQVATPLSPIIEEEEEDEKLEHELEEELKRIQQEPRLETIPEEECLEIFESPSPSREVVQEVLSP